MAACGMVVMNWEHSGAFHLDGKLHRQLHFQRVIFIPLARQLTQKSAGKYFLTWNCATWYKADLTHPSPARYAKLGDAMCLPIWLQLAVGEYPCPPPPPTGCVVVGRSQCFNFGCFVASRTHTCRLRK